MTKHEYYLSIAEAVAMKSTCLRRKYGAIIVKDDVILSTGYNGSPRGCPNCSDLGTCMRKFLRSKKGEDYNYCLSVHAEMNAMINARRADMLGSTIYVVGLEVDKPNFYADPHPCLLCHRMMINAGITEAYGCTPGPKDDALSVPYKMDIGKVNFMKRIQALYNDQLTHVSHDQAHVMMDLIDRLDDIED